MIPISGAYSNTTTTIASEFFILSLLNVINLPFMSNFLDFLDIGIYMKGHPWASFFALTVPILLGVIVLFGQCYIKNKKLVHLIIPILSLFAIVILGIPVLTDIGDQASTRYIDQSINEQQAILAILFILIGDLFLYKLYNEKVSLLIFLVFILVLLIPWITGTRIVARINGQLLLHIYVVEYFFIAYFIELAILLVLWLLLCKLHRFIDRYFCQHPKNS